MQSWRCSHAIVNSELAAVVSKYVCLPLIRACAFINVPMYNAWPHSAPQLLKRLLIMNTGVRHWKNGWKHYALRGGLWAGRLQTFWPDMRQRWTALPYSWPPSRQVTITLPYCIAMKPTEQIFTHVTLFGHNCAMSASV